MKVIFFLFFPIIAFSQANYQGNIVNKATQQKIPFATVGLLKENAGVNADDQGFFNLVIGKYRNDTMLISCVGYETLKIAVDRLSHNTVFEMTQKQVALKEVFIGSYHSAATLNDYSSCGINSFTTNGVTTQIAQSFHATVSHSLLSEIDICQQWDNSIFRLRIYGRDSLGGMPGEDLADTIIEIKSGKRHIHIDMEPYGIRIPGKDFFVAIEWLKLPYNQRREKIKMNGVKSFQIHYTPCIFIRERKDDDGQNGDHVALLKSYRGDWTQVWKKNIVFLISAKVRY